LDRTEISRSCIQDYARLLVTRHDPARAFATWFGQDIIQHDPDIADGGKGDEEFLESRRAADPEAYLPTTRYATIVHNIMADGDLVALKSHVFTGHDDPGRVFVDIWRVADGRFAEHWSAIEGISAPGAGAQPIWCGVGASYAEAIAAGDTVSAPICGHPGDPAERSAALATVRAYLDLLREPGHIAEAVERHVAPDFLEYSPRVRPGRQALVEHLSAMAARGERFEAARLLADGGLVLLHGHGRSPESKLGYSDMHLFRVAGGRIAAHWHVRQEIPPYSVAGHGMVGEPLEPGRRAGHPQPLAAGHAQ